MNEVITIGIADAAIARQPCILVTYALGSCVGVCLYEKKRRIGGMVHILLPSRAAAVNQDNAFKFADSGVKKLLDGMLCRGAERQSIIAKIAGGAEMFQQEMLNSQIGKRNVAAVKAVLRELRIPLAAEHTGSNFGRTIWLSCQDGSLKVRTVNNGIQVI